MRIKKDDSGQLSIDFLIGVTIFILAFLFLFMAIPSMFTPFQSNSDELTMIADRVASILIEDRLAERTDTGEAMPSIVNGSKVDDLCDDLTDDEANTAKSLGLDNGDNYYHLQVIFQKYDLSSDDITPTAIPNDDEPGLQNVGQSRRFVYYRDSTSPWPGQKTIMVVRVW